MKGLGRGSARSPNPSASAVASLHPTALKRETAQAEPGPAWPWLPAPPLPGRLGSPAAPRQIGEALGLDVYDEAEPPTSLR